jgi:hypothetical protein
MARLPTARATTRSGVRIAAIRASGGKRAEEITLHLHDVKHLFVQPDFDPFGEHELYVSGIEYLVTVMQSSSLRKPLKTRILLPPEQLTLAASLDLKQAIARYCRFKLDANKREFASLLWVGTKAMQTGILMLVACLSLAALVESTHVFTAFVSSILSEGLTVIGWVSLWRPVEVLLYDWWPSWRERRVYERILRMQVEVASDTGLALD